MDDSLIDEQNRAALESHDLAAEAGPDESGDDWPPDDEPPADWPEPDGSRYVPGVGWIATSR